MYDIENFEHADRRETVDGRCRRRVDNTQRLQVTTRNLAANCHLARR